MRRHSILHTQAFNTHQGYPQQLFESMHQGIIQPPEMPIIRPAD